MPKFPDLAGPRGARDHPGGIGRHEIIDWTIACADPRAYRARSLRRGAASREAPAGRLPPMWLVRIALQRPYTFVVMSMLIVILGVFTILRMPTDIFPDIDIPVISVIWNYGGLPPEEMEKRIVTNYERVLTTTVNDIEHVESQTLAGVAVVKIFFQPGANIDGAGDGHLADHPAGAASRSHGPADHSLQRVECPNPADCAGELLTE